MYTKQEVIFVPTTTYNNLSDDKKARLIKAGRREFTKHSLQTSSLNSILKRAEIPKGSFYAYFQDKEEFYWYVLNDVIRPRISSYESLLSEFEGDLFLIEEIHLQEMIQYDREPNEKFKDRAIKAIEGDSTMGNKTYTGKENGNTEPVWGASDSEFGKKLTKTISRHMNRRYPFSGLSG